MNREIVKRTVNIVASVWLAALAGAVACSAVANPQHGSRTATLVGVVVGGGIMAAVWVRRSRRLPR